METITNGCVIEINETGTRVSYKPGVIMGGEHTHECGLQRSIGYFLEPLVLLAPFAKKPCILTLRGITNDDKDLSVDTFRTVTLPLLRHFGLEDGIELKIQRRGATPNGGGEIIFKCPVVRTLKPFQFLDTGKIQKIRGVAYSTRVSPQIGNRVVEAAKEALTAFTPNVFIYTDHYKGPESGLSPGFALCLVAESTTGAIISAEYTATAQELPEDVGQIAARMLLQEILLGGCVDSMNQSFVLFWMALSPEDVSKIRLGKLSPYTIQTLRHLRDFFGVTFKIEPEPETQTVLLSCLGCGYKNYAKTVS